MNRRCASRSARISFAACAVLLLSFAVAAAEPATDAAPAADGWFDGAPPDGSFRVRGPVAFQSFAAEDGMNAGGTQRTQGVRATQPGAFDGVTKYVASCLVDVKDHRDDKARIEETLMRWKQQGDFLYRRPVANGKLAGVEFEMADPSKTLRLRVFAPTGRVCTLLVQWNPYAKPRDEDIERFLASFALAKP